MLTIFVACLPLLSHLWLQLCHPSVTEGHLPWLTVISQVFPDAWSILGMQQILVKKIAKEKKQGREGYKNMRPIPHLIYLNIFYWSQHCVVKHHKPCFLLENVSLMSNTKALYFRCISGRQNLAGFSFLIQSVNLFLLRGGFKLFLVYIIKHTFGLTSVISNL